MLDLGNLFSALVTEGLGDWRTSLEPLIAERTGEHAHGDLKNWREAVDGLPEIDRLPAELDAAAVGAPNATLDARDRAALRKSLLCLRPWRKGPFVIDGIHIDAEWRSDLKWDRVVRAMHPLEGRLVLDVGCGNGYYALRMLGAGARRVLGIDPTLLYVLQFEALTRLLEPLPAHVLPLRLSDLPARSRAFDSAFSMGVLYHQRAPLEHLRQLREALRPGGQLVLETLILPGDEPLSRTPAGRYARMRNVWHLPSVPELQIWLARSGFTDAKVANVTATTIDEQRSTEWMPFESLAEALDPAAPERTVEGWPAPRRALLVARAS